MSNALAITKLNTIEDLARVGDVFVRSGFFNDTRDAAQAIVKVMAGQELGFAPIASMTGVYIVKGKVSLSANLIAAAVKRSGRYTFRVRKHDATVCEIEFFELDKAGNKESIGISGFSMQEATQAGLTTSAIWKNYPRNMLYARAMSNGAKWYCPDVFGGPVYTPDELGATIDGETGEVIDVQTIPVAHIAPSPAVIAAPVVPAGPITDEQIESLTVILDGIAEHGIEDDAIRLAVNRITGVSLSATDAHPLSVLSGPQAETLIERLGQRLAQLDREAQDTTPDYDPKAVQEVGPQF